MTLKDYLRILRGRWKILVATTLICTGLAILFFVVQPAEYTAKTSLYVSAQGGENPQQAYQGAQLSEQRVKSYNELVTSDRVLSEAIRQTGGGETLNQLGARVTASSALDSVIINISVSDESPTRATLLANTIGNITLQAVDELERPATPGTPPAVAVRVVQPALTPDQPSSAGLAVYATVGLLLGLVAGVGAALVTNTLDTSIKSADALFQTAGTPILGTIGYDKAISEHPLTVHSSPETIIAESYRQLRTNLQFVDIDNKNKIFVVTSSTPGEGKTTTVANLAVALAAAGKSVLVVDADLRRPRLSKVFGIDDAVGLTSVLTGRISPRQAIQPWGGGTMDILSSGVSPPNPSELLASGQMRQLLNDLRNSYEYILLDTPPLLPVTDAAALAPVADGTILICRHKHGKVPQVRTAVSALKRVSVEPVGAVLTMAPITDRRAYGNYAAEYTAAKPTRGRNGSSEETQRARFPTARGLDQAGQVTDGPARRNPRSRP